jgi:hypothetical protein
MSVFGTIASLILIVSISVYLHAIARLHTLVASERPEWIDRKGSLSIFYMSPAWDPNVVLAVIGVALSSRAGQLSAAAQKYVLRIRISLPIIMIVFSAVFVWALVWAP